MTKALIFGIIFKIFESRKTEGEIYDQLTLYILSSMLSGALIYTWLYNRTGSVFLCILFHTLHNNALTYIAMLFPSNVQSILAFTIIAQWIVAIVLMRFFWKEAQPATSEV